MCFNSKYSDNIIPYNRKIKENDCCKCWYFQYYEYFNIFAGSRCAIETCDDCLDGDESQDIHTNCFCNSKSNEPPCTLCVPCLCPIILVLDIITCPIRLGLHTYKINKHNKTTTQNHVIEINDNDSYINYVNTPELSVIKTQPTI